MLKHYIISTLRILRRHKVFTGINVLGLSIAILASLVILKHVAYEHSFDSFHNNTESVYRVSVSYTDFNGVFGEYPGLSGALGLKLVSDIPEILDAVRIFPLKEAMRHTIISANLNDNPVELDVEGIMAVDQGAFEMFTFEIIQGSPDAFSSAISSVAISESTATKFFGLGNPVGEVIKLNGTTDFVVSSVFKDWPSNSHFHPEILVQMKHMEEIKVIRPYLHFIGGSSTYNYIRIDPKSKIEDLQSKLDEFVNQSKREQDYADTKLHLMPFENIHLEAHHLSQDMAEVKNGKTLKLLLVLATLIILMAWANYINLITSGSLKRSKEIAIRKIHGAGRYSMFVQLLTETLIVVFLAGGLAFTLDQSLVTYLSQIVGQGSFSDLLANTPMLIGFLGIMMLGVMISVVYPSAILSSFKNTELIKGNMGKTGKSSLLKKTLMVIQYMVTIGLVFGTLTVIQQIRYLKSIESNVELDKVLVLKGPGVQNPEFTSFSDGIRLLSEELKRIPGIERVATSNFVPGFKMDNTVVLKNPIVHGTTPNFIKRIFADESFVEVYGIDVVAGRFFDKETQIDFETRPIVVSESAAIELGFDPVSEIVGKEVQYWNDPIKVIGVVKDFRMESPDLPIEPLFFFPTYDTKYFSIRLSDVRPEQLIPQIKEKWNNIYPGNPFDFFYSKAQFDNQYGAFEQFEAQLQLLTILSLSIAVLGLFALAFDAARTRAKEVGVRKILGAGVVSILKLFIGQYIRLILLAALIAVPLVYYLMNEWLNNYASRIEVGIDLLSWSVLGILMIAILVIGFQTIKTARTNPVDSLRHE